MSVRAARARTLPAPTPYTTCTTCTLNSLHHSHTDLGCVLFDTHVNEALCAVGASSREAQAPTVSGNTRQTPPPKSE